MLLLLAIYIASGLFMSLLATPMILGWLNPNPYYGFRVKQTLEDTRAAYTADVVCAEVRFLQIAERRASVRYLIGPEARYRVVARATIEDFEKHKQAIKAFFESFRVLPTGKQNQ